MTNQNKKIFIPITLVFIILNGVIIFIKRILQSYGFDSDFLIYINVLIFLITIVGLLFQQKGLLSPSPNVFVRSVYASIMFKMFSCIIAALVYVFLFRNKINMAGLFTAMGIYIVYTTVEVSTLMKVARKKNA